MSLAQLTAWCDARFGPHAPEPDPRPRPYDIPWLAMDNGDAAAPFRLAIRTRRSPFWRKSRATPKPSRLAGTERAVKSAAGTARSRFSLLSVVIPARNEEGASPPPWSTCIVELRLHGVPHEIVVVDDGSTDSTWSMLQELAAAHPHHAARSRISASTVSAARLLYGIDHIEGDAVVMMMADESDDCRDVVRYWQLLNEGWDAVFGSRFIRGGGVIDYPRHKLLLNRMANLFLRMMFRVPLNDFTNAFKAYRRNASSKAAARSFRRTSISPWNCR